MPRTPARKTPSKRQAPAVPPSAPSKGLQTFANPAPERDYVICFDVPEFTCLCPLSDLVAAIAPRFVRIHADWCVRGGIRTFVTAEHRKKGWQPQPRVELPGA